MGPPGADEGILLRAVVVLALRLRHSPVDEGDATQKRLQAVTKQLPTPLYRLGGEKKEKPWGCG